MALIIGTSGRDRLLGDRGGARGNDVIFGNDGDDFVDGRSGNDLIFGGTGSDTVFGGVGLDTLACGWDPDEIIGGGGFDIIGYFQSQEGVFVDLLSGAADGGDANGDRFSQVEGIAGSAFDDRLFGDDLRRGNQVIGGGGNDNIDARGGNDTVEGGIGADFLAGGDGSDTFIYAEVEESSFRALDVIRDFSVHRFRDICDICLIDANVFEDGDQMFRFIGREGFSGEAGELRFEGNGGGIFVLGDVNGDKTADLAIDFFGLDAIGADSFLL